MQDSLYGSLAGRHSGGIDQPCDISILPCRVYQRQDGVAGRQIHLYRYGVESRLVHRVGDGIGILLALVSDDDFHSVSHAAGNGHTNLSGTGQYQYFVIHASVPPYYKFSFPSQLSTLCRACACLF